MKNPKVSISKRIEGERHSAIMVHDNKVLLIHRYKNGEYWVAPGGHREQGENGSQTVLREIYEETGLQPQRSKLLYQVKTSDGAGQPQIDYVYLCTEFQFKEPELVGEEKDRNSSTNSYQPQWVNLESINELNILPVHFKEYLLQNY